MTYRIASAVIAFVVAFAVTGCPGHVGPRMPGSPGYSPESPTLPLPPPREHGGP